MYIKSRKNFGCHIGWHFCTKGERQHDARGQRSVALFHSSPVFNRMSRTLLLLPC